MSCGIHLAAGMTSLTLRSYIANAISYYSPHAFFGCTQQANQQPAGPPAWGGLQSRKLTSSYTVKNVRCRRRSTRDR